ncbi:phosphoribosylglycinamide formyltransferase [Izhakiella australiensis]|uniref:Phosphoribosylglycinamide formyltransferase n=1 Tax=Izhakiella australiensis TaxID=1926881 RepID=A0A1S8YJI1_9GAMM|nr:phosphoribosylglycinamide formyltransferase [Izhakiella australiensis]OON39007.1 phosphoribosylglycinamide formyltransferase [Izhakiella australiensis]
MKKIVVLISGDGSNLQAILTACQQGKTGGQVVAVISNKASAYGLQRARDAGLPAVALAPAAFADRQAFDRQLMAEIDGFQPDLVVLAGYMRILSDAFVQRYTGRMLNVHPSLLPKYPGLDTHRQAIENGDAEHGTSVHFVTEELDGGPVILQARVPIFADDSVEEVQARVQHQEHAIYPLAIAWFCAGRLQMRDGAAWLDGQQLAPQGYAAE